MNKEYNAETEVSHSALKFDLNVVVEQFVLFFLYVDWAMNILGVRGFCINISMT